MITSSFAASLTPYLVVLLIGVLPNELWRWLGVFAARGLRDDAEILVWVKYVAIALVAGVVAQLIFSAPGALAGVPAWGRYGALALAVGAYFGSGRRIVVGLEGACRIDLDAVSAEELRVGIVGPELLVEDA